MVVGELGGVDEVVGGWMLHHLLARPKLVSDNYRTQLLLEFIHPESWCLPRRTDLDALSWKNGDLKNNMRTRRQTLVVLIYASEAKSKKRRGMRCNRLERTELVSER